jgi:hypothetical protein
MTKKIVFSILMVLFVSTAAFSQIHIPYISYPSNGENIYGSSVSVIFDDYGNGLGVKPNQQGQYNYFDVFVDGALYSQINKSPVVLSGLTAGSHTVTVALYVRGNVNGTFFFFEEDSKTFNIIPTVNITSPSTSSIAVSSGNTVNFTASSNPIGMQIHWDICNALAPTTWVTDVYTGNSYNLPAITSSHGTWVKVRAHIHYTGGTILSQEIMVIIQ